MNIVILVLTSLIILIPTIVMLISFKVYINAENKKKLAMYTLPNFILTVAIPAMISFFAIYGGNYVYAFEAFLNGIVNGKVYICTLFILIILQIVITCMNGISIVKEMKYYEVSKKGQHFKFGKSSVIILICVGMLFISFIITDICRLEQNLEPIFCITIGMYKDGGTIEYIGIGYKIIDYNKLEGYNGYKIGTWFMSYDNSL